MEQQNVNSIEIYTRSIQTFSDGSMILSKHVETAMRATAAGQALLAKIEAAGGMTPELDKVANDHLALASQRKTEMENSRKTVTQIMDAVKGLFTAEEAKIDVKKPGTMAYRIQEFRNNYARQVAEEQRRQAEENARKAAKEKEAAELKAECERRLNAYFSNALVTEKTRIQNVFNQITVDTYDGRRASLLGYLPAYTREHYNAFVPGLTARLHDATELTSIISYVTTFRFEGFAKIYVDELKELKQHLLDRLPSKLAELQQMANADAEQKRILEEQRQERERQEQIRLQQEEDARKKREEDAIAAQQAQEETMALFSGVAEIPAAAAPETRQGYEIIIKHQGAWAMMFQLWFTNEGAKLALEKFPSKKLESIKTWCENYAHKQGVKLESPYLEYQETYKAVNRKSVAA